VFTGGSSVATFTYNETGWFMIERSHSVTEDRSSVTALGRYVQGGDTTTMPVFCTAGSGYFAYAVQEVSGVTGTWATDYHGSSWGYGGDAAAAISAFNQKSQVAGCYALIGFNKYNESAAGTVGGGFTADVNTFNTGNYGSFGCAHKDVASVGSDVQGLFTAAGASGNPRGIVQILLTPSQPTIPTIVRVRRHMINTSVPGVVKLAGAPKVGSLILGFLHWNGGAFAGPVFDTGWTQYGAALNGALPMLIGLYRYGQSGDTRTLPNLCTSGATYHAFVIVELSGMSGTFAADHGTDMAAYQASGATLTTTSDTTTHTDQVCLTAFGEYSGSLKPTMTGATEVVRDSDGALYYGGIGLAVDYKPTTGSVQTVWTLQSSTHKSAYLQSIFGYGAGGGGGSSARPVVMACT